EEAAVGPVQRSGEDVFARAQVGERLGRLLVVAEGERRRGRMADHLGLRAHLVEARLAVGAKLGGEEGGRVHEQRDEDRREHDHHGLSPDGAADERRQPHSFPGRTLTASASRRGLTRRPRASAAAAEIWKRTRFSSSTKLSTAPSSSAPADSPTMSTAASASPPAMRPSAPAAAPTKTTSAPRTEPSGATSRTSIGRPATCRPSASRASSDAIAGAP